jgi:hypothetical protein
LLPLSTKELTGSRKQKKTDQQLSMLILANAHILAAFAHSFGWHYNSSLAKNKGYGAQQDFTNDCGNGVLSFMGC